MWTGTRTLVTGGRGFLGSHVVSQLTLLGADPVAVGSSEADLTDFDETIRLFECFADLNVAELSSVGLN